MTPRPTDRRIKAAAHVASYAAGRATQSWRLLPGLLIVGAQRCGTTSMYRALAQHPALIKPVLRKGVHYFDVDYRDDLRHYRAHFPLARTGRASAAQVGSAPVAFESSPYYLWHPLSAERIAADLPGATIVVLVRDPVERAYSAYTHELARGYETEDFETALKLEDERLDGAEDRIRADPATENHSHRHHAYVRRGQYAEQLERLAGHVGRENVIVIDSHDFFADPAPAYGRVLDQLALPGWPEVVFDQHNARSRLPLDEATRRRLRDHFEPHDRRLEPWLGATPSWWR